MLTATPKGRPILPTLTPIRDNTLGPRHWHPYIAPTDTPGFS